MKINWIYLISFIILCNLIGAIGGIWTDSKSSWYEKIKKSPLNPPSWVFGIVWTILFTLMGISLYLIYNSQNSKIRTMALILFCIQFIFNILWSYLFFGLQNPLYSFIDIILLLISILLMGYFFFKINKIATFLNLPYFLWVSFASYLNYFILRNN